MRLHGGHRRLGLDADLLNAIEIHRPSDPIRNETERAIAVNERQAEAKIPADAEFCDDA
jgi:hypothetical protein